MLQEFKTKGGEGIVRDSTIYYIYPYFIIAYHIIHTLYFTNIKMLLNYMYYTKYIYYIPSVISSNLLAHTK